MNILVKCSCGANLKAPPQLAGRKTKCPKCSSELTVPAAANPVDPNMLDPLAPLPTSQQPPQGYPPQQQGMPQQPYPPMDPLQPQYGNPPPGYPPHGYPPQGYPQQGYPQQYPPQGYPPQQYPPQGYPPQTGQPPYYQQGPGQHGYGHPPQAQAKPKKPKKKTNPVRLAIIGGSVTVAVLVIFFGVMYFIRQSEDAKIASERRVDSSRLAELNNQARVGNDQRAAADTKRGPATQVDNKYDTGSQDIFADVKGSDVPLGLADLIERVTPSIVRLNIDSTEGPGTGSGFFIDTEGKIATNFHVVEHAIHIYAETADGQKVEVLGFVSVDTQKDLAIVQIDPTKLKCVPLPIAKTMPRAGDPVAAFGAPQNLSFTATNGIISAVRSGKQLRDDLRVESIDVYRQMGFTENMDWIQTSAAISGGNSGGPLVNMQGEMVGINTWKHAQGENLNFSSAMTALQEVFADRGNQIKSWGSLPRKNISRRQ